MHADKIKQLIETGLKDSTAMVAGDDGIHFSATVISSCFVGKNRVEKQQLVYKTLGNHLTDGTIHAISIRALTPEEWQAQTTKE